MSLQALRPDPGRPQPTPEPVYIVRCTARGCDWSVQSNVAKRLRTFWRWHAQWHRSQ